jgi:acyl-CoA synthetase
VPSLRYAPAPLPPELPPWWASLGYPTSATLGGQLARNRLEVPHLPAVIDGDVTLGWAELADAAGQVAAWLTSAGVGPGDAVCWQLPNWWEAVVVAHAIWAAGAVSSPVVPIYREHELRQIVRGVRPRVVVGPASFRGCDHVELLTEACRAEGCTPELRLVVRGRAPGWTSLDDVLHGPGVAPAAVDPEAPAIVGWTSGTTAGAKGVVHSHRTYGAISTRLVRSLGCTFEDRSYAAAPVAHATGLLLGLTLPAWSGGAVVLAERWDAGAAVDDILGHGVTYAGGPAVFLTELTTAVHERGLPGLPLRAGWMAGASTIPLAVAEGAEAIGLGVTRSYGSTEIPCVTGPDRGDPVDIRLSTDGRLMPGCEVRVEVDGRPVGPGIDGELLVRGPQRTLGYLEEAHTRDGFDAQGWFRTGDVGRLDERGALSITGRTKDIINRGGEKFSAREVEDALVRHPAVAEAAVVPAPDPRLGEQPAAFLLLRAGHTVGGDELATFLVGAGLARAKVPRIWRSVDELPRTPSGKVKKFVLVDELTADAAAGAPLTRL